MNIYFVNAFLIANFGFLLLVCQNVHAADSTFNGTVEMEHLQSSFLKLEHVYESAKANKSMTQIDGVVFEAKKLKAQLITFRANNAKAMAAVHSSFMGRIVTEIDQLGSFQIDLALTWIAQEVLGYHDNVNVLVERHPSAHLQAVIQAELVNFGKIRQLGFDTQKLITETEAKSDATKSATILKNLDLILLDAANANSELVRAYQQELLQYNFQNTKDLSLAQKYLVSRFTNMFSYIGDYAKNYKEQRSKAH